ncbi:MAG: threonine synthase [Bauldia sp.]|uniref:threonine synthase n=1 Tax=Bauldia sp. TaxID=2575872 RepID=UPI001E0A4859|nr:threonine synthase [Bauldia sp.]MCB1497550.1 threonine synthase [Bauldia sp.]
MKYVSTRGRAPALGFSDVLLTGLAGDGGLYVPETWPSLDRAQIAAFAGRPYAEVATEVIRPFASSDIDEADLARMCDEAYATFRHPAVAPLTQVAPGEWVLELFHGPTLAFKDLAMQLLSRLMDHVLTSRGEKVTIIGATSGDTGGAAIEAFRGRRNVDLFMLFPENRVSPFQQRQMTTSGAANIHPIAVKGTFDDCQAIVKAAFGNRSLRERLALSGVNSINWARIVAQIVYYFTSAVAIGGPARPVSFTVPTGNFGDIYAGYAAKRMGLPIADLVIATNINDILSRTLATGRYEVGSVQATASPSMDIQVSSNFERALFDAYDRDAEAIERLMAMLAQSRAFTIGPDALETVRKHFDAGTADEDQTRATIAEVWRATGFLPDPHTAVGLSVARRHLSPEVPMITLSTAHPAKFPAAVEAAIGAPPALPPGFDDLASRREDYVVLANDQSVVEDFLLANANAVRDEV